MAVTPTYSFRYPVGSDDVDIPSDIYNLAADVESVLTGQFLKLSGGTLTGSLSGTSLSLSSTLSVTGNTTLTGTLNGKIVNDLVTGPASATDNALVRFDNTTGKVVQNSGITVDDSGNLTTSLNVTAANSYIALSPASGTPEIYFSPATGVAANIRLRTSTSNRWVVAKNNATESGSNVGSDFSISSFTDAGAALRTDLYITRSTGKWTCGSVGATAGLELGASGPRVMSGTGSPEGVVTAPVGSQWTDTNATTGAIRWIKATGTGNTGWVVEYGDTGRRSLAGVLLNSWTASSISLQRSGNMVTLWARTLIGTSASNAVFYTLPVGFRPTADFVPFPVAQSGGTFAAGRGTVDTAGDVTVGGTITDYTAARLLVSFPTADAWPATLPGS